MRTVVWIPTWTGFPLLTASYAHEPAQGYGMGPDMMGWGWGMGWYWPVMMLIFWIAVIAVIVFIVRWLIISAQKGRRMQDESALDILKKRYARGDINKDEYEKIKKDIQGLAYGLKGMPMRSKMGLLKSVYCN